MKKLRNISGVESRLDQYTTVMVWFFRSSLALSCLWKINDVAKPESHQLFKCWISKKKISWWSEFGSHFIRPGVLLLSPSLAVPTHWKFSMSILKFSVGVAKEGKIIRARTLLYCQYDKEGPWNLPSLLFTIFASSARPPNNKLWFLLS